jgi:oxygen-independent coproporphyrinogen-3 oxidase
LANGEIWRTNKTRVPKDYLANQQVSLERIAAGDVAFEFMLNALRLIDGVPSYFWPERSGLSPEIIASTVHDLRRRGLLEQSPERLKASALGLRFLNRAIDAFLPEHSNISSR